VDYAAKESLFCVWVEYGPTSNVISVFRGGFYLHCRNSSYQFLINSRGVATVVEDPKSCVHGAVWWLTFGDEMQLDFYECFVRRRPQFRFVAVQPEGLAAWKPRR